MITYHDVFAFINEPFVTVSGTVQDEGKEVQVEYHYAFRGSEREAVQKLIKSLQDRLEAPERQGLLS